MTTQKGPGEKVGDILLSVILLPRLLRGPALLPIGPKA